MRPITVITKVDRPAEDVFAYATDPTRFHEWQAGVVDGRWDPPGVPDVGSAMPDHPAHRRCKPFEHLRSHPHQPTRQLGVRGIEGPIRASLMSPSSL